MTVEDGPPTTDAPIQVAADGRFLLALTDDEVAMLLKLLGELREMLNAKTPSAEVTQLLVRLFPVAYPTDDDAEADYQRWMRTELMQSKLSAFDLVADSLNANTSLDESGLVAFMQSINSIRLVLGTMLKVSDDPDAPEVMPGFENSREYHLYGYLSWLLDWSVQVLQGRTTP